MVPLILTIDLCIELFTKKYGNKDVKHLKPLLELAVKDVKFLFNDEWYVQNDGVSMGSPLAPTMAEIFMSNLRNHLNNLKVTYQPGTRDM